jgi:outer membrane immunogenic protein
MKKLIITAALFVIGSAPALAADIPSGTYTKAPVRPGPGWTGCYVGVDAGGGFATARSISNGLLNGVPSRSPAGTLKTSTDSNGGLLGGTLGCNYQVNNWVLGVEGDGSWFGNNGTSPLVAPFNSRFTESVRGSWLATVRGRAGFIVGNNILVYGTAGGAFTDLRINESNPNVGNGAVETHQFSGWTAGVGYEWGFFPNWSAKFEYLYADFGKANYFAIAPTGCCTFQTTHLTDNMVRLGINYRIDWAGPVNGK